MLCYARSSRYVIASFGLGDVIDKRGREGGDLKNFYSVQTIRRDRHDIVIAPVVLHWKVIIHYYFVVTATASKNTSKP
jgi:hypothetical protein